MRRFDYILVGSGIAGLYTALQAREHGSVLILTKGTIEECNTKHAQGGIAAPIGANDSPELHFQDTIAAGDGLCNEEAVRILVNEAPDRIADLVNLGVPFDTLDGKIALTTEAAHSVPRILHAGGDATGEHIELTLSKRVRATDISVLEQYLATEIIIEQGHARGVRALNCRTGKIEEFAAKWVILATGGGGQLFKFNTNSEIATADGIALAYEAGAEIADMEFFQFHPTAFYKPGLPPFLISEAVRGEGGILRNINMRRFMYDYTPEGELAPRDVVARSIVYEMEKTGADHVYIDVTHLSRSLTTSRFPHIYRFCLDNGLDITKVPVPVAPAAHYMMGGVKVNTWGETSIPGLFATGETACTGVHGANRLASNSMLEVLVFSKRIMERTGAGNHNTAVRHSGNDEYRVLPRRQSPKSIALPDTPALQSLMWNEVGIIRNREGLKEAVQTLAAWHRLLPPPTDRASRELRNMVVTGRMAAEAALAREESRGAHFRFDFPQKSVAWQHHIIFHK
ncbi:MAG TPA: L-aspartate oxidase [Dehalococcoidales bacterium]|nr:L-aspartate oxidase [Dehalococcoidales bacterium]